ncbi:MAG: exopolysaccharide biosynthesis protein [Xanthobacteraceae bacterium]
MEEANAALVADATAPVPASMILKRLNDQAPTDHFTLGWLLARLSKHSFGILLLLLSVIAVAPGVAIVAGVLLFIPAFEMIAGRPAPVFPRWLAAYPLSTPHLAAVVQRAIPVLRYLEKFTHPRWPTPHEATKRTVGIAVALLSPSLVFLPIPLSGVIPAMAIGIIALAYLEEDGLLLSVGLLAAIIVLMVEVAAIWAIVRGAKWIVGL